MERAWKASWLWAVAAAAGLALVMVAIMLSSGSSAPVAHAQNTATPVNTSTPVNTATPTATPVCDLEITKDVTDSTVPEGGTADYTITVTNNGDDCTPTIEVSDVIPSHTDCADASVDSSSDISDSAVDISDCDSSTDTVTWSTTHTLASDDQLVLDLSLDLTSSANEDDKITNEACITEPANLKCDSARITVTGATSTPTTAPTATPGTPAPTVVIPTARPVIPPVGAAAPTISVPVTGTGSSGGGSSPWPLALGLLGGTLILGSGVVLVKRTR